jgi:D-methionine transport system ATP-binding protein
VAFALKHSKLSKDQIKQRVDELLDLVGLSDRSGHYPAQLSGGQKQRVAIARALANNPDILISDEATSALDVKTTDQILDLLDELNRKFKLTIVMVTHEMQVIKRIADRVAVMEKGQIIETGTTKELFSKPKTPFTKELVESTKELKTFHNNKGVSK